MAKVVKREMSEVKEDDKTIIYMIVGFCFGAVIALLCFEYYWIGVGGGAGMLLGISASAIVDYLKAKNEPKVVKTAKKAPAKKATKKVVKKAK